MRIKSNFLLSNVSGKNIVVPVGERCASFNGMMTLNDSGAFLWKQLETDKSEAELVSIICSNYPEVEEQFAVDCVREFVKQLKEADCLE